MGTNSDGVEFQILLADNAEGTYEVGGGAMGYTASYDLNYYEQSGTVTITENNTEDKTITGTFNLVLFDGLTVTTIDVANGEFLVKY
ncbi:MAG: DUF6252 family protein [Saprospiraceae bacterium]